MLDKLFVIDEEQSIDDILVDWRYCINNYSKLLCIDIIKIINSLKNHECIYSTLKKKN